MSKNIKEIKEQLLAFISEEKADVMILQLENVKENVDAWIDLLKDYIAAEKVTSDSVSMPEANTDNIERAIYRIKKTVTQIMNENKYRSESYIFNTIVENEAGPRKPNDHLMLNRLRNY